MRVANGLWAALALILLPGGSRALREGECEEGVLILKRSVEGLIVISSQDYNSLSYVHPLEKSNFETRVQIFEVCVTFLGRFYQSLKDKDVEFTPASVEKELMKSCKEAKGKENRLCYYIGATSDAATKMVNEVSKPLSHHIPVEKVCEKLKKKDSQICELKYDKQIDLSTVDLKKLRVKELKKILDDWGETCKGCAEKSDYIRKINELMPKYAPKAASSRTDL